MTPPDARNALAEIVAGLEPLPQDRWSVTFQRANLAIEGILCGDELLCGGITDRAVTSHFMRCHPDTMRSIAALVASQDARIAALEAQVEGMRWTAVPNEPTLEFLKSINIDNQVLAYENGRYYNAWFEFEQSEGGWFWTDDADSEPSPSHYCKLPAPPARAALQSSETTGEK